MKLPFEPPVRPMLARLERELPRGEFFYEPKWDGFRSLAFRCGDDVQLQSRHGRPLARYFPEVVDALRRVPRAPFALDGEIVVSSDDEFDFLALLARIHPARSRVERLREETPATFVAFDMLACDGRDVRGRPFRERRHLLADVLPDARAALRLTPITTDPEEADAWLHVPPGRGIDGVVAKHVDLRYEPGARAMVKVKRLRTADCVVAGFRMLVDRALPSSLLLALYGNGGELHHVGVASAFTQRTREELLDRLRPYVVELAGHPWEHGFLLGGNPAGRLLGSAGAWTPAMTHDWVPVAPELVCEVAFDQVDVDRFRHPARFVRWRPDREPLSCTLDQLHV